MVRRLKIKPAAFWLVSTLLIPVIFILYPAVSMRIWPNIIGWLDHLLFVAVFFLLQFWIFQRRKYLTLLPVLIFSVFFTGNLVYFRFFHTWIHSDIMAQWSEVPAIWSGIVALLNPLDLILGIGVPVGLWSVSLKYPARLPARAPLQIILVCVLLGTIHLAFSSPQFRYSENNPFLYPFRQKARQWKLKLGTDFHMKRIHRHIDRFRAINPSLYERGGDPSFPFEKHPLPTAPEGPLQWDRPPNVVLILLESVRAFESGAYGATPSFTPQFDKLAREGFLFSNFYANASQTARAEFTILNSYLPNYIGGAVYSRFPELSIVSLPTILKNNGYQTSWISSFTPKFGNKEQYLSRHGIGSFHHSIPGGFKKIGWGPSDQDLFRYAFDVLSGKKEPFFAEIMTLSNHHPFDWDYPTNDRVPRVKGNKLYRSYTKGIYYTDHALGQFIERARRTDWGKNTLFVITGDHGVWIYPDKEGLDNIQRQEIYFRVPLLFWAPKYLPSKKSVRVASQIDIAPSIIDLLNIRARNSFLGTSLFRPEPVDPRVLMLHDERWNLRFKNEYLYDAESDNFMEHFPFITRLDAFAAQDPRHDGFTLEADLLTVKNSGIRVPLPEERRMELEDFAEESLTAYLRTLFNDRISRPEDAFRTRTTREAREKLKRWSGESLLPEFIAHAGGGIEGKTYTNSLEALNENYKRGFRVFELDFQVRPNGKLVLRHDHESFPGLTPLRFTGLVKWLERHKDATVVTDFKENNINGLRIIREKFPEHLNRFIPQIYGSEEYLLAKELGFRGMIFSLYQTGAGDQEILAFAEREKLLAVTMWASRALKSDLALNLKAMGVRVYAHTVNDPEEMKALKKRGVAGVYTDFLRPVQAIDFKK